MNSCEPSSSRDDFACGWFLFAGAKSAPPMSCHWKPSTILDNKKYIFHFGLRGLTWFNVTRWFFWLPICSARIANYETFTLLLPLSSDGETVFCCSFKINRLPQLALLLYGVCEIFVTLHSAQFGYQIWILWNQGKHCSRRNVGKDDQMQTKTRQICIVTFCSKTSPFLEHLVDYI